MSLIQVVYISRVTFPADELARHVQEILHVSRANNPRDGVTGALLAGESGFAQVLEGPADAVETVFERIQCDPRHDDVTILATLTTEERSFANWSMALCDGAEALAEAGTTLEQLVQGGTAAAAQTLAMLRGALHRDGLRVRRDTPALDPTIVTSYVSAYCD